MVDGEWERGVGEDLRETYWLDIGNFLKTNLEKFQMV
jgi:hypothetical protein